MGLYKRGQFWWMRFSYQGKVVRKSTDTDDRRMAEAILGKVQADLIEGKYFEKAQERAHTFKDMMARFLEEHGNDLASAGSIREIANRLSEFFGEEATLADITPDGVSRYKTKRKADGLKPASINRELAWCRAAFNYARRHWQWCKSNPFADVGMLPGEVARDRWLTEDEQDRLFEVTPPWLRELILFDAHTGLRQSELLNLTWSAVNLPDKALTVLKSKNKTKRGIPLDAVAMDILRRRPRALKTDLVFYSRFQTRYRQCNIWRAFKKAVAEAGIVDYRFHDTRHTFGTRLAQGGIDLYRIQRLLGHLDAKSTQRYAHHSIESLRPAVKVLESTKRAQNLEELREAVI